MIVPGYWMNETSGVLRPVITAFINGEGLSDDQVLTMCAYLRQWMEGPWKGPGIPALRQRVNELFTRADIESWLDDALALDIDPL